MNEAYEYMPLSDNEICLLEILPGGADDEIECRMRTVSLENPPAYGALSYVWGDDKSEKPILVDGKTLSVWPNLEAALLEFRREPPTLDPVSHIERVRNVQAAVEVMSSDVPFPPPYVNENWFRMKDTVLSCRDNFSRIIQKAETDMGIEAYHASEAGEDWTTLNEKYTQLEILAEEFTYPKNHSWLVKQPRLLWIDAICINQQDPAERVSQVRIMGEIYLKAFLLVIWLDHEKDGSGLAFENLSNFSPSFGGMSNTWGRKFDEWMSRENFSIDSQKAIRHAIAKLFDRPWFTRGWIRQEYIFGALGRIPHLYPRILVTCGRGRARNLIEVAAPLFAQWHQRIRPGLDSPIESFSNTTVSGFINAHSLIIARTYFGIARSPAEPPAPGISKGTTLFKLVAESAFFCTTNPRDKIYSVLGLFQTYFGIGILDPLPAGLVVDYNAPVQVVYSTFVNWVVETTRRLDVFIFLSGPYNKLVQQTWCPDWSINPRNRYHYGRLGMRLEIGDYNYQDRFPFDATPGLSCEVSFTEDLSAMTVLGIIWDVVLRSPVPFARPSKLDQNIEDYSKWSHFTQEETQTGCQHIIASVRKETTTEPSPDFYAKLLEVLTSEPRYDPEMIPKFKNWCWSAISNQDSPQEKSPEQPVKFPSTTATDGSETVHFNADDLVDSGGGTTFVLTEKYNVVRPSYDTTQPGDLICVFPGCPTPMMLRPVEEHFKLLGPVYVPGIMLGEAMTALEERTVELREFELH